MPLPSLGDLAQNFVTRRQNTALKTRMSSLTAELASGRTADVARHLGGRLSELGDIEHRITLQQSRQTAAQEAGIYADAMQIALEEVHRKAGDLGVAAALAAGTTDATSLPALAEQARGALDSMVSALNRDVAGRPVFGGDDPSSLPLASAGTLLDAARLAVAGAIDAAGVEAGLDAFFGPGGGFETTIYRGGGGSLAPHRIGDGTSVELSVRADDPALRGALRDTVMAALADDSALGIARDDRMLLLRRASDALLTGAGAVTGIQARLGSAQSRIEQAVAGLSSELAGLESARNTLLAVDPYDTASELEQVQFQLETLYAITARSSRLNLVNFLS
ncbi:flagellar biosynthesis protein FlgL [Roseovarius spongiae]|uniref:Flagellar biosynthesis protein FlgL n=1 Tax=Roseovarius spongiae TaxID=2320272 RepID=A0A3A8B7W3_9RHOB|nr:flagellin [Roseovarius spongiae]RKF13027.1 flagellar biosynthesis protein FlgL [Roseovarius spongiae]